MRYLKKDKGVTLIALVITIIVLLILAGVTISYLVGDNGVLKKAVIAVQKFSQAQEDEDNALNNLGNFGDEDYGGEYRLGFVYNDNVKKYFDSEYISNAFFVVGNNQTKHRIFRNHISFHVAKEANKETWETKEWNNKYTEDITSGFLCDDKGYPVLGWEVERYIDEDGSAYENIKPDTASLLNLSYEVEGKERIGTEIDPSGYIYAKFSDDTKSLIGQIPVASFASSNSLTMIEENVFEVSLASGEFDGIGMDISAVNGVMKRITKDSATEISKANENRRNNNYTLSIKPESNYYFPLYNTETFELTYAKKINLYECFVGYDAITPVAPYIEEDTLYGLYDENRNELKGWQIDPETGDLKPDVVSRLQLGSPNQLTLSPQATTKARLVGDINDDIKSAQLSFYDVRGDKYLASFDITGTSGVYNLKLNDIKYADGTAIDFLTDTFKNTCSYNLQYNVSTGKPNIDNIMFNVSSLSSQFEDISIDVSNSNFSNKTSTVDFETGDSNGEGKGRQPANLLKFIIKENGRIYGLYENGEEILLCAIAVSNSNEGEFYGVGVCPEENYMTISRQ